MKKRKENLADAEILRQKAEKQLVEQSKKTKLTASDADILKLLHELQVHQIELEMQNEELLIAKKKSELAEKRYSELYDFAPSGYLTLSEIGEITELNFAAARMLGKERSRLIDNRFGLFISSNTLTTFNHFFREVYTSKEKQTCEVIISIGENSPIYVILNGTISPCGNFCFLTLVDITKRKLAEIDLLESTIKIEESENRFQQLAANIDECFWLRDDSKMLYVSPGFEKIWGLPCQSLYDDPQLFTKTAHPEDKPVVMEFLQSNDFIKNGFLDYNYRIIREDKETRWINAKIFPVMDNNGVIIRSAGITTDITEKIQKHQELIKAKEEAEKNDLLKSAFLANMSHEIRTPMNGILGFAHLLDNPELTYDKQLKYIRIIEKSGARMLNIINDIIDISKIEAGLMGLEIKESIINEQIEYIYTFFKPEVEAQGMLLSFKNHLPKEQSTINTDPEKIYAILTNLVKNAIKYSKKGEIEFGYLKKGDFLEFYVTDNGIGIPEDRQTAIFERFVQADINDLQALQGAGLGLTISNAYVEMLGGKLWVKSEKGKGSTFYFTIPYTITPQKTVEMTTRNNNKEKSVRNENLKILIAEDDETSDLLISIMLSEISRELIHAKNGLEAVELCRHNPDLDLILMDIKMPAMNGYETTQQIRQFNKDVIIIAQTSQGLTYDRKKAIEAGCDEYLSKPINKNKLMSLIQQSFAKKKKT
ncbi:PAS domain-containing hybrid sensor histidine kinase/response regulator [Labilibaculum antarcticum]|uniref:histidine kinase n=1 Tax=Labilibaculum antarcticum TaxID=1717717 RepID=A0A1Y1CHS8_9BACT|nr:PAS domain-containing hybrid sensor histidine kinase/response regulator [Labilibaculum antarcticum]BAX79917.1 hybrid sensor histidine kinase/response regulator [Labilibaculum antarcticum]